MKNTEKQIAEIKNLGFQIEKLENGLKLIGDWNYKLNDYHKLFVEITGSLYTYNSVQNEKFLANLTSLGSLDTSLSVQNEKFLANLTSLGSLDTSHSVQNEKFLANSSNVFKDNFIYFDGILSKYSSVKKVKDIIIYTAKNVGSIDTIFIAQKGDFSAHGETVKKAIQDLQFKIIAEKLKKDPILPDTKITIQYYRIVTGACEMGAKSFQQQHNLKDEYLAKDLLPILEKHGAYGIENFKKLINW